MRVCFEYEVSLFVFREQILSDAKLCSVFEEWVDRELLCWEVSGVLLVEDKEVVKLLVELVYGVMKVCNFNSKFIYNRSWCMFRKQWFLRRYRLSGVYIYASFSLELNENIVLWGNLKDFK